MLRQWPSVIGLSGATAQGAGSSAEEVSRDLTAIKNNGMRDVHFRIAKQRSEE